jgi:hypothetical protein
MQSLWYESIGCVLRRTPSRQRVGQLTSSPTFCGQRRNQFGRRLTPFRQLRAKLIFPWEQKGNLQWELVNPNEIIREMLFLLRSAAIQYRHIRTIN